MSNLTQADYEDIIRRLKLLSKSQTAFLKKYVHDKFVAGINVVREGIDVLERNSNDPQIVKLKNSLIQLDLESLNADVGTFQIMMGDEISLLRNSIDGKAVAAPAAPSVGNGANKANDERVRALEADNTKLRGLLKQAQEEISRLQNEASSHVAPPRPPDDSAQVKAEFAAFKAATAKREAELLQQSEAAADAAVARTMDGEVAKVKKDLNAVNAELAKTKKEMDDKLKAKNAELAKLKKDSDDRYNAKVNQLNEEANRRVAEVETRLEAEKEGMIDAMAQEVEEIEKAKNAEQEALVVEKEKVELALGRARNATRVLSGGLVKVAGKAQKVKREYSMSMSEVKREMQDMKNTLRCVLSDGMLQKMKDLTNLIELLNTRYRKEMSERKRLHNLVQELKGNIRVFLRCRPPSNREIEQYGAESTCITFPNPQEVKVFNEKSREKTWEFDEVFDFDSKQEDIYTEVSALVTSVLDGFNVCIFAYGQTGSGKTHTMSGPPDNRGVNTRALDDLFIKTSARSSEYNDTITVSVLEVYNEDIRDLLSDSNSEKLEIRQGEYGNHVPGLTQVPVDNLQSVFDLLQVADRHRSQTATNMNEHSSRSHMMLTVNLLTESLTTGQVTRGKLNLVDLAGSERINKSGATGQALKEAQNINKSLSALGDVIAARAAKQGHVPFRNSTLTYLLQDSLSQDSKTLMIVCASPILSSAEETFCSLNFASRVRTVELGKASKQTVAGGAAAVTAATGGAPRAPAGGSAAGRGPMTTRKAPGYH